MTTKEKLATLMLMTLLFMIWATPASAGPYNNPTGIYRITTFYADKRYYVVNDCRQTVTLAPYIKDGRMMVPVSYAVVAIGLNPNDPDVQWDPVRKQVTINNGYMIVLGLGSKMLLSDGEPFIRMDVAPEMIDRSAMLPIRFLGEALGEKIDWNQAAQAVTLTMTYTG
jgi:hypothetical protein